MKVGYKKKSNPVGEKIDLKNIKPRTARNKKGVKYLKIPKKNIEPTIANLTQLKKIGYSPIQISRFYYKTLNIENLMFTLRHKYPNRFERYDISVKMLNKRAPAEIMLKIGFSLKELKTAGYTAKELIEFTTPKKLKEVGFSARNLQHSKLSAKEILDAGYTLKELIEAGFGPKTLMSLGFSEKIIYKFFDIKNYTKYKK